jgi:hypothetical protein
MMAELLLLLQLASTLAMVGLIWFVQVVHYPLFSKVGQGNFRDYEQSHQQQTTLVVAPLMLTEALTAVAIIWLRPAGVPLTVAIIGLLLVGLLWASTFFWQVPAHGRLAREFDAATHRRLVASNWFRTVVWSVRGLIVCWMWLQMLAGESATSALASQLP